MAVSRLIKSQLRLIFENGTHPTSGNVILKTKSFNNVQTSATADQLHAVGTALVGLQTLPFYGIERYDNSEISEA